MPTPAAMRNLRDQLNRMAPAARDARLGDVIFGLVEDVAALMATGAPVLPENRAGDVSVRLPPTPANSGIEPGTPASTGGSGLVIGTTSGTARDAALAIAAETAASSAAATAQSAANAAQSTANAAQPKLTFAQVTAGSTATIASTFTGVKAGSSAVTTLTLPSGMTQDVLYVVKDQAGIAGSYAITINYDGTHLIDGQTSVSITRAYGSLTFWFDGTEVNLI